MAVSTKVGSFVKNTATGTQAITGVGFTPKAIIFWTTGGSGTSGTWTTWVSTFIGFTTGTANSYSSSITSKDALTSSVASRRMSTSCITSAQPGSSAPYYEAALSSLDVDGFTINWTTNNADIHVINYLAIGGSDITNAKAVNWTAPTAVGSKSVTGVGFSPDLVLNLSDFFNSALPVSAAQAYLAFGAMNKHGQQWADAVFSLDVQNPSNTSRFQQTDACLVGVTSNEALYTQAHFSSMDADGFTTYFSTVDTFQANQVVSLCLKGVSSKLGAFSKTTGTAPVAQSVTRVGFTPKALMLAGFANATASAPQASAEFSLGVTDGTAQRVAQLFDQDNVSATRAKSIWANDSIYIVPTMGTSPTTATSGSFTSFDTDGFTLTFNPNTVQLDEVLYLAIGDTGTNTSPIMVQDVSDRTGTSTDTTATAYSNQRKIDRCQNGNIVVLESDGSGQTAQLFVSADTGVAWSHVSAMDISGFNNGSIFVDLDDYLHVVWRQSGTGGSRLDGTIYYMRGTPNTGRTSWTWSAATALYTVATTTAPNYPDVVAHREGTGWTAHVVCSYNSSFPSNDTIYIRVDITSGSVLAPAAAVAISSDYATNIGTYPSIDFNHTGDAKTVASSIPHLYAAWSAGKAGTGFGVRFKKATYSAGTWTWGTEREIDSTVYISSDAYTLNTLFDGTRILIGGDLNSGANSQFNLYERDVADTTTTTRNLAVNHSGNAVVGWHGGSMTYDGDGNVYFIGRTPTVLTVGITKFTRSTLSLGTRVVTDMNGNATSEPYVSAKRGYGSSRVEWISTAGNNSPYAIKYDYNSTGILQIITPDSIAASTNVTGSVTFVQDSPDSPDANNLTTTSGWSVRFTFPTPTAQLITGAGLQKFRFKTS